MNQLLRILSAVIAARKRFPFVLYTLRIFSFAKGLSSSSPFSTAGAVNQPAEQIVMAVIVQGVLHILLADFQLAFVGFSINDWWSRYFECFTIPALLFYTEKISLCRFKNGLDGGNRPFDLSWRS